MSNKIVLTIRGTFKTEFDVSIDTHLGRQVGQLPSCPQLPDLYQDLQSNLNQLLTVSKNLAFFRGEDDDDLDFDESLPTSQQESINVRACQRSCRSLQQQIETKMQAWLKFSSSNWATIREHLREAIGSCKDIIIRTDNLLLYKLPWHVWDILQNNRDIEVTFAPLIYQRTIEKPKIVSRKKPNILAVMGNDRGIDCSPDRVELQRLEESNSISLSLLEKPVVSNFFKQLRDRQGWDVFVFSGHSTTENRAGKIYIDESQSVTIADFKNSVREAASNGLQLAIFNSCQGLGIAENLVDLQVPVIIVMREPVDDRVAQQFLKDFLGFYTGGETLTVAVRRARERLEDYEPNYWPSSTWLPLIFRNPSVDLPLWKDFDRGHKPPKRSFKKLAIVPIVVTAAVLGIRHQGWLETWELNAYDWVMRSRLQSTQLYKDDRLLVIKITEEDIEYQKAQNMEFQGRATLSEDALEQTLQYLQQNQARIIGLDIYRNFPASSNNSNLAQFLRDFHNLFVICKRETKEALGIGFPPEVEENRVTFSNVLRDKDDIVRRHLLTLDLAPDSLCPTYQSFSIVLAENYLSQENIHLQQVSDDRVQLGPVTFDLSNMLIGAYQDSEYYSGGYQMMLNYSIHKGSLTDIVDSVPLRDILENRVPQNFIQDRIVLIGTTAESAKDYWIVPYSKASQNQQIPGIFLHAQMISQILSAVLDGRPFIRPLPQGIEFLWIGLWSVIGSVLGWYARTSKVAMLAISIALFILVAIHAIAFSTGLWISLIPPALTLAGTLILVNLYCKKQENSSPSLGEKNER